MRMHRMLTGLVAFALIGLVPFVSTTSADAATSAGRAAASTTPASSTTARAQLPAREITAKIAQPAPRKLVFKGKVKGDPKYAHKLVKVERRIGKGGNWKLYKKLKSGSRGGWATEVGAPRTGKWYFRAVTPETNSYRKSFSRVWYTYSY
jgi:hypothetical protein